METAGEGGAWGIALLASYLVNNDKHLSLADFLDEESLCRQHRCRELLLQLKTCRI
jgi:hypothetical protein